MSSLNNDAQHEAHCAASVLADRASGPANSREARSAELSEENYRHIIELSPQIPWIADGLGNVTEVGPQWAELIGISREEGLGLDSLLHVHPDDVNQTAQRWVRSIETGEPLDSTIRLRLKDGRYEWFRTRAAAKRDASGEVVRWYGVIESIHEQIMAEIQLKESEENYRYTIELSPQIPWAADPNGNIREMGPRWLELIGMSAEEAMDRGWAKALHPNDKNSSLRTWLQCVRTGEPLDMRYRLRLASGGYSWFRARAAARRDASGQITRWYGLLENIQDQVAAEIALQEREKAMAASEERFRLAARATNDLLWDWDLTTDHLHWNEGHEDRLGYAQDQLGTSGQWWKQHLHPADRARVIADVMAVLEGGGDQYSGEYRFQRADGSYAVVYDRGYVVRDTAGRPTRMVGAMQDLSHRKEAEAQLLWSATHDTLTGLPNRRLFQDRLADAIGSASKNGKKVGLLELDIDHFKQVNDTLGHSAGDELLRTFADRLWATVRSIDTVARLGGDELAVILPDLTGERDVTRIVEAILEKLREPLVHAGHILDCKASIGASIYPQHGASPNELLQNADVALYMAKTSNRGGLTIFRSELRAALQQRSSMISVARDAVADDRIVPFYQPKVDLATGRIIGFEALLRWRHPRRGIQQPSAIAAAFDDLDVAAAISDRMIERAVVDMRLWLDRGVAFGHVAINAAAAEFRRGYFADRLLERLKRAGIAAHHIQVEVTEGVFLGRGAEFVERALKTLSQAGVKVALDDFGTGYASLRHLKEFPVDVLKIDRSFVQDMHADEDDAAIIQAVLDLGRNLGIDVVAEGVETKEQADGLLRLRCQYGQGFLFSKAVPASRVAGLITTARCRKLVFVSRDGKQTELDRVNTHLADIELPQFVPVYSKASDGQTFVHELYLPHGTPSGTKLPLVVFGYPGDRFTMTPDRPSIPDIYSGLDVKPSLLLPSAGYAVLLPSLPGKHDRSNPIDYAKKVELAVDDAIALGYVDPGRMAFMGESAGGYLALAVATRTDRFKAIIAGATPADPVGIYGQFVGHDKSLRDGDLSLYNMAMLETWFSLEAPLWKKPTHYINNSPIFGVHNVKTPLMLIHGDMDFIPVSEAERVFSALIRQGKDARLLRYWGEGHAIASPANIRHKWQEIKSWLDEHLNIRRDAHGRIMLAGPPRDGAIMSGAAQ